MGLEFAEVVGHLSALQRFPVEPLGGENPNTVVLRSGGLVGERLYELHDVQTDRPLTTSLAPLLLLYNARYMEDLVSEDLERWMRVRTPFGDEYAGTDPRWLEEIGRAIGRAVRLSKPASPSPALLHVISRQTLKLAERTYGASLESQRLRANLVVEITEGKPFGEDDWIGRQLRIGEALLEVSGVSTGCIVTSFRAEAAAGDPDLLAGLVKIHGHLGVVASVRAGSRLRARDPVVLVD